MSISSFAWAIDWKAFPSWRFIRMLTGRMNCLLRGYSFTHDPFYLIPYVIIALGETTDLKLKLKIHSCSQFSILFNLSLKLKLITKIISPSCIASLLYSIHRLSKYTTRLFVPRAKSAFLATLYFISHLVGLFPQWRTKVHCLSKAREKRPDTRKASE